MAVEIAILCLRPLPAMGGGWSSAKWRTPKLAGAVVVRPAGAAELLGALSAEGRAELREVALAPFVAGLQLVGPATTFELAIAYAQVVAEACSGIVLVGEELSSDRRASTEVWSGTEIEARWRAIDAEAARSDPAYQPVRGPTDDHRPTQTFAFAPRIENGVVILGEGPPVPASSALGMGTQPTPVVRVRSGATPLASVPASGRPPIDDDWSDVMPK